MKRFMILATAALLTTGAFAQTATVEIAPEQRTKIKRPSTAHPHVRTRLRLSPRSRPSDVAAG